MKTEQAFTLTDLILIAILTAIVIFVGLVIVSQYQANMKVYNKHMCAVYGYYQDCKTVLPESMRLK